MKFKELLLSTQKFFIVKKSWKYIPLNRVQLLARLSKSKIRVFGKGNCIKINFGNYKKVKIGIDGNNNSLTIEEGVFIRNLEIIIQGNNHNVYIGKRVEIGGANIVCCGEKSKVYIGNDCLLASNISIKSCDGHAIYKDNKIINHSKEVIISERVWISQDVNIIKGAEIGSDSVIGIGSLVTSNKFASNVILGGIPAKILKREITWSKEGTE